MKDSEFIELLNLYLDHEISAEDAARIETEVQQNPARRRIYQQYCRVQKACTLLAKDYVDRAATTGSSEDRKIAAFEPNRSWDIGVYVGGLAAAAACLAVVLVSRSYNSAPPPGVEQAAVAARPAAVSDAAQAVAVTVPAPIQGAVGSPVFTAAALSLTKGKAEVTLTEGNQQAFEAQFDWLKDLQLTPIQRTPTDQLRFDTKAEFKATPRTYGPGHLRSDVENAAFQFAH